MGDQDSAYATIARAVRTRWRRRLLAWGHLLFFATMLFIPIGRDVVTYTNPDGSAASTYTFNVYVFDYQPWFAIWAGIIAFHCLWAVFAELRDRAIRREIERERKWRLLERIEDYEPPMRERVLRLAETRDGELIDFDTNAWESNAKRKREEWAK